MKKIGLLFKEKSENYIKDNLKESNSLIVVQYSGLNSPGLTTLRQSLKDIKASLFVVNNNIARCALKNSNLKDIINLIEGPCGLVFVKEEAVDACRILYSFSIGHEQLKLKGGLLKDKILGQKDIETLAKLPSKEILRTQLVSALNSPISKLAIVLKEILKKFAYCIDQIKQKIATTEAQRKN